MRDLFGRSHGRILWKAKGPEESWLIFEEISSKQITFHLQKEQPGVDAYMDLTVINHRLQKGRTQRRPGHPQLRGTEALHEHGRTELGEPKIRWN